MENHEFDIFINDDSIILILGSFPSVVSRKRKFYYMHPSNRFYKVLTAIFDDDFINENIEIKKKLLKKHHIALYDVIKQCNIIGSSDNSINNEQISNISDIVDKYPIKLIALNGKKAFELFIKHYPKLKDKAIALPSTSAANATFSLEKLIEKWQIIRL